jgi:hypothetical protein
MSFNYVSVFDQLRNVAMVARKCPTPVLQAAYVTAMRTWCTETKWLRTAVPGATAADVVQYDLGTDTLLEIVGIHAMSVTHDTSTLPVVPSDSGGWSPMMGPGMPRRYAYIPEGQFALNPTPDRVYNLAVTLIVSPKETAREVPDAPLRKYSEVFEAGALAYLLALPGTPWSNPRGADSYERKFKAGVSNGKADVQRNFNTGSQRVRPRPVI